MAMLRIRGLLGCVCTAHSIVGKLLLSNESGEGFCTLHGGMSVATVGLWVLQRCGVLLELCARLQWELDAQRLLCLANAIKKPCAFGEWELSAQHLVHTTGRLSGQVVGCGQLLPSSNHSAGHLIIGQSKA